MPASAHVRKTDGSITVLFHADPTDDPVAGQPAELYFGITDTTGRFSMDECNCSLTIANGEKQILNTILSTSVSNPSIFNFSVPFIFPEASVYQIIMTGTPKVKGAFQDFSVTYDLNVKRGSADVAASNGGAVMNDQGWTSYLGLGGAILVVIASLYFIYREIRS